MSPREAASDLSAAGVSQNPVVAAIGNQRASIVHGNCGPLSRHSRRGITRTAHRTALSIQFECSAEADDAWRAPWPMIGLSCTVVKLGNYVLNCHNGISYLKGFEYDTV